MLARRTQTNEPARCAMMLPLLAALPQPLALLEVGASAGLCLLPDRYAYDYDGHRVGDGGPRAALPRRRACRCPAGCPRWSGARGWTSRRSTCATTTPSAGWSCSCGRARSTGWTYLRGAVEVARADPPRIVRGDLTTDLPALAAEAPRDATLVIFHTAVLAYVPSAGREAFAARRCGGLDATWIAIEDAARVRAHRRRAPAGRGPAAGAPAGHGVRAGRPGDRLGGRPRRGGAMALIAELRRELRGEVRDDAYSRHLFSTDASMYAIEPSRSSSRAAPRTWPRRSRWPAGTACR